MKHFITLIAFTVSTAVLGQIPNYLPYNPDSNNDYFISLPDLLEFLVVYGSNWESGELIVSDDSTSALIHVGDLYMHECLNACSMLGESWEVATRSELIEEVNEVASFYGSEVILSGPNQASLTNAVWYSSNSTEYPAQLDPTTVQGWYHPDGPEYGLQQLPFFGSQIWIDGAYQNNPSYQAIGCWCSTEVSPRIEYHIINSAGMIGAELTEAANQLANEGWYLIETDSQGKTYFWRFAQ